MYIYLKFAAINTFTFLLDIRSQFPCTVNSDLRFRRSLLYVSYRLTSIVTVTNIILTSNIPLEDVRVEFVGFR